MVFFGVILFRCDVLLFVCKICFERESSSRMISVNLQLQTKPSNCGLHPVVTPQGSNFTTSLQKSQSHQVGMQSRHLILCERIDRRTRLSVIKPAQLQDGLQRAVAVHM